MKKIYKIEVPIIDWIIYIVLLGIASVLLFGDWTSPFAQQDPFFVVIIKIAIVIFLIVWIITALTSRIILIPETGEIGKEWGSQSLYRIKIDDIKKVFYDPYAVYSNFVWPGVSSLIKVYFVMRDQRCFYKVWSISEKDMLELIGSIKKINGKIIFTTTSAEGLIAGISSSNAPEPTTLLGKNYKASLLAVVLILWVLIIICAGYWYLTHSK